MKRYATALRFDGRTRGQGRNEGSGRGRRGPRAAFRAREGKAEVSETFEKVMRAGEQGPEAGEVANRFFFETVVRVHRAGTRG